jgi:hypothetical protein
MTDQASFTVRLYEHVEPLDRGDRYEDPLGAAVGREGLGTVTGGGSLLSEEGEIEFAEIEVDCTDQARAMAKAVEALEAAGAPQGSEIRSGETVLRSFGRLQCLAIYLDGVSLPDEVYADLDFDALTTQLDGRAGEGSYRGFWQGPTETGLYFFSEDAEEAFRRLEPLLLQLPIGQNARVVIRRGRADLEPRTVRMPRRE